MSNVQNKDGNAKEQSGLHFVTERLIVRDHVVEDLQGLASLICSEKEMHYIMDIYAPDMEAAEQNLATAMEAIRAPFRDKYFFAIIEKRTGEYIGEIGFTVVEKDADPEKPLVAEMGYFIKSKFWGRGMVVEAGREVLAFAFETLGLHKIVTGCVKDNVGSESVMIKLGFTKEGELKRHQRVFNEWKDRVIYGYLREDYLNK